MIARSPLALSWPTECANEKAVTAWVFSTKRKEEKCVNMGRKQNSNGLKHAHTKFEAKYDNC
jgi:hypothetical protein